MPGGEESILRLDHIQPIGKHHESIELTDYRLGEEALDIIDEWITWLITGKLVKDGYVDMARKDFIEQD